MKTLKLTFSLIFCYYLSFAQNITGTILEEKTNTPLVGVNIYLENTKEGTTSDKSGKFNLKSNYKLNKNDTLYISCVGYKTEKLSLTDLDENKHIVYLTENLQKLKEVTVSAKRFLKKRIEYHQLASLKKGLFSAGTVLVGDKIFVIGGDLSFKEDNNLKAMYESEDYERLMSKLSTTPGNFSWNEYSGSLHIYDIHKNTWTTSNLNFEKRACHNTLFYHNKIYVLGGKRLSLNQYHEYLENKIEVYDLIKDTIVIDYTNPHQATNFASVLYGDNVIVLGGSVKKHKDGKKEYTNQVHLYNLKTGYWYLLDSMPEPKETKGILVNNKIYLLGGFNRNPMNEVESYDLKSGEWKLEGNLFHSTERPALASINKTIFIYDNGRICTYNTETKELYEYSIDLDLKYAEMLCYSNKLYIIGGYYHDEYSIRPSSDLYSIDVSEFNKTKPKNSTIL